MGEPKIFDEDSSMYVHAAAAADVTGTAAVTYGTTEQAMLNDLKARVNSILAALRSANIIAGD